MVKAAVHWLQMDTLSLHKLNIGASTGYKEHQGPRLSLVIAKPNYQ
jgi:hypothetical protein